MDKIDHNAHSVYLMYYHLIMVVKYRRKVIDDPISERAKEIWERIAPDYGITLEEWNHDVDHVHVMFRAQPKSELSKFINAYKSASSRLLKKEYPQIRERLWKEAFWSQSFCLLTAGGAPIDVIRSRELGLPEGLTGVGAISLGYPDGAASPCKPRKEGYVRIVR